jgi:hypothetical protein
LSDETAFNGAYIDASISSRASTTALATHDSDIKTLINALNNITAEAVRDTILSDATRFKGADVTTILSEIQNGSYGLNSLETILNDIKGAGWTTETLKTIYDNILAAVYTQNDQIGMLLESTAPITDAHVVDDVANTASTFKTNLTLYFTVDDYLNGMQIVFKQPTVNQMQVRKITDYDGTTGFITVSPPFYAEPDEADEFALVTRLPLLQSDILSDATPFAGADIGTILLEIQHGTYGLSVLKTLIDAKASQTSVDTIDSIVDDIKTEVLTHPTLTEIEATAILAKEATFTHATYGLDKIKTETAAIKAKTDLIPADITTQLDTNVPAIKAKTDLIPADITTQLDTNVPAIKAKTDALPTDPADESLIEAAITAAHATTDGKVDTVDTVVDAIKTQTDKIPRILCHMDFWSLAKQITITATAGDKGLIDVVVSGLPSNITIIAVQGLFMCDTVQNSAVDTTNYLESTKIQVHKKTAGTDRDAIVLEANKVFQFNDDMIRGGTVFVADWATATVVGILAEVATNTTYEMWFDVAEALANNLVLDGAAFGLRIWFTI